MRKLVLQFSLFTLLVPASEGLASDGVLEINQACAVNTGCFIGDIAAFPVTIEGTAGRSYRLTSDLIVPDEDTSGIVVSTSSVSIDLNGFEIVRSGCEGAKENCTPATGTGNGIECANPSDRGISVKNGSVTGMGSYGVFLGQQAEATNLRVRWNRTDGIFAWEGSLISSNTTYENGGRGIVANRGSTISGNTAYKNGSYGIYVYPSTMVLGNTVYLNGVDGIFAFWGVTVLGNTANENGDDGIEVSDGSTVKDNTTRGNVSGHGINASTDCTVKDNTSSGNGKDGILVEFGSTVSGNTASRNSGDGIQASAGSTVLGNTTSGNTGWGLALIGDVGYSQNVIRGNTAGTVSDGIEIGVNLCTDNTTCP